MKMDAMQTRKMLKVAIAHFALTVLVAFVIFDFYPGAYHFSGNAEMYSQFQQYIARQEAQRKLWSMFFYFLQPQFWLFYNGQILTPSILNLLNLVSIPFWSFCFGWLYVKFTNWLNHFPVLGKKVFSNRKS